MSLLNKTIKRQGRQTINTLIGSLKNCPEELYVAKIDGDGRSIQNIVEHCAPFGPLPTGAGKEVTVAHLEKVKKELLPTHVDNTDLLSPDEHPEYFVSKLDNIMKTLRHCAQHTGEINQVLTMKGISQGNFIS